MTTYVYVDNSNIYIEGCRVSAVKKKMAKNIWDAQERKLVDHSWQLDYGRLYDFLCEEGDVAKLWGSPPPGDSFWDMVKRKGFIHTVYDKNFAGKEKKVDVAVAHQMTKDAYTIIDRNSDEIILVAGDTDYIPALEGLTEDGFKIEVAFWDHLARELKEAVKHIPLDKYHDHFTRV